LCSLLFLSILVGSKFDFASSLPTEQL